MKKQELLNRCRELNLRPGDKVKVRFTDNYKVNKQRCKRYNKN